ncbi:MAG: prenyltransferase [Bacteroidales bacterium]|nr:prenyltransferase [Bacteroidales bacterium]
MGKHTLKEWIFALRPWSFPASAMPIVVTLAYLFWKGAEVNWVLGLWALVGMVLFHCTGNVWSDYFDFRKKVDAEDTFGAKTMTTGMFQPHEIRNLALGLLVVSVACGLGLLAVTGLPLLWIGIAGVACTLLYPVLKYNALGDFDIVMAFAFLPTLGTSYAATGVIDWNVLLVALPVGLITDGILHSNNSRDVVTDRRAGITTMAMSMGPEKSVWLFGFEMLFPYIWVAALSMAGLLPLHTVVIFLTLPIAIGNARTMSKSLKAGSEIIADLDVRTANLQLLFSVLLAAAFFAAKFI